MKSKSYILLGFISIFLSSCEKDSTDFKSFFGRKEEKSENLLDNNSISTIKNREEFLEALKAKKALIVFENGVFDLGVINISYPVNIKSKNIWNSILSGTSYLVINSKNVSINGFRFENGASPSGGINRNERHGSILIESDSVKIIDNYFENIGIGSTIEDKTGITITITKSKILLIKNNVFNNSHGIAIKTDDFSKDIQIINNNFTNSKNFGGAGEVVHIGDANSIRQGVSPVSNETNIVFRNNFISNWNLEYELISIKSDNNIIEENLIENCDNSAIVIRMGNNNIVRKNKMFGNRQYPVRISGENNTISENLFCGEGSMVSFHSERAYDILREDLYNSYWAANFNIIKSNTYYGYDSLIHYNINGFSGEPDYFVSAPKENQIFDNTFYNEKGIINTTNLKTLIRGNIEKKSKKKCE